MADVSTAETVKEFNRGIGALASKSATSGIMESFQRMHQTATAPGALETATKELMALAIAITTQCDGCIAWHVSNAVRSGACREQVLETIGVAIMMGGGPATYYGSKASAALDEVLNGN